MLFKEWDKHGMISTAKIDAESFCVLRGASLVTERELVA